MNEKIINDLLKGCEHDGSFIPVNEVKRLMSDLIDKFTTPSQPSDVDWDEFDTKTEQFAAKLLIADREPFYMAMKYAKSIIQLQPKDDEVPIKCATFNKELQDSIPKDIRAKMDVDRKKAELKQLEQPHKVDSLSKFKEWCKTEILYSGDRDDTLQFINDYQSQLQ